VAASHWARTGCLGTAAALLTLGLLTGCNADQATTAARASGWHRVSAPPDELPGEAFWVADEMLFLSLAGGPSFAYRPGTDTWRSVTSPPRTEDGISWAMVSTGDRVVAVTRTATVVYSPRTDSWRPLSAPPASRQFVPPDVWRTSLVWTGREVAMAQPSGDDMVALDVVRGRWRSLPRTGAGSGASHRLVATEAGLVSVVDDDFRAPRRIRLLLSGSEQWRLLADLPAGMNRVVGAGSSLFVSGTNPSTDSSYRGRYVLPKGRWEPLAPSPVIRTGGVTVGDGGLIALWHGNAAARPERPNGALLRPGRTTWEAVPPPPDAVREAGLVPAGKDFLLLGRSAADPSGVRPLGRFRPPSSPGPPPPAMPAPESVGVCRASSVSAARRHSDTVRGASYEVTLTNRSEDICALAGPVELTATDAGGAPLTFPGSRSDTAGPRSSRFPISSGAPNSESG